MADQCTICDGDFDLDSEGGAQGYIGILPVQFCPTCKTGIMDFADYERMPFECPRCGYFEGDSDEGERHKDADSAVRGVPAGADGPGGPGVDSGLAALIADNLCTYDPRSSNFIQLDGEDPWPPRTNCACDNCFYGRDALALELAKFASQNG